MTTLRSIRIPALGALALVVLACAGPPVPTPIEDEPICPDFEIGATHAKLRGGLRFPGTVTVKEGQSVVMHATVLGLRNAQDVKTRVLLRDTDASYTVEWAQCQNERAPGPADHGGHTGKNTAAYECGKADVYKTESITTKRGDLTTHVLHFAPPPNPACWTGEIPTPAMPASVDAGTPATEGPDAAAPEAPDAGASDAATDATTDAATAEPTTSGADAGTKKKKKKPAE